MLLKRIRQCFPWFWLAFCVGSFLLFLHQNLLTMLDADMASEMVLANHIANSGKLIPTDWYYSTEIHLLNNLPLFFVPFFRLFDNWHWVRLMGTFCAYGCLLLSFYYLCRQLKLQHYYPFAASTFFLPLSDIYAYVILIGCYYLPYAILSFLFLGTLIHCITTPHRSLRIFLFSLVSVLGYLLGITSLRMVLQLILPVFIAAFLLHYILSGNSEKHQTKLLFSLSTFSLVLSMLGYLFNSIVLSQHFVFRQYNDIFFTDVQFSSAIQMLNDLLSHLGYKSGGLVFSPAILRAILCLFLLFICVTSIAELFKKDKLDKLWVYSLPAIVCFSGIFLLFIFGSASSMPYYTNYLIPSLIFIPLICTIVLVNFQCSLQFKRVLSVLLIVLLTFCGIDTCRTYNRGEDCHELQQISASLVQDGYTEGYSTFWRGNLVTELSNGKLDMRVWDAADSMDITSVNEFLQLQSHATTVPHGKTFIIFNKYFGEHTDIPLATWLQSEDIYWDSKDFLVYGYENYDVMLNSFNESINQDLDRLTLAPMAATSLSSIPLYPGSYTVAIKGEQLNDLEITCKHSQGMLTPSFANHSDGLLTFQLDSSDLLHDLQIELQNNGDHSSVLESFQLEKRSSR